MTLGLGQGEAVVILWLTLVTRLCIYRLILKEAHKKVVPVSFSCLVVSPENIPNTAKSASPAALLPRTLFGV